MRNSGGFTDSAAACRACLTTNRQRKRRRSRLDEHCTWRTFGSHKLCSFLRRPSPAAPMLVSSPAASYLCRAQPPPVMEWRGAGVHLPCGFQLMPQLQAACNPPGAHPLPGLHLLRLLLRLVRLPLHPPERLLRQEPRAWRAGAPGAGQGPRHHCGAGGGRRQQAVPGEPRGPFAYVCVCVCVCV